MKKILSFFLVFYVFSISFAQLDREHWFAPMIDRVNNPNPYQKLYLSTNRTTPFPVTIYNNNVVIGTVTISKNNPQKFDILRDFIITTSQTDLFTPTTKGLYLKAEFPFYANLRFSVLNHAEIITSKGIASTGLTFHAASAPITVVNGILNFMTSVLATEDNTTVTVSGYKPTVQFSNGTNGTTTTTFSFTLNKGQSYIIDGIGDLTGNADGFIGAKIQSNKPINVTNGNFNGQYAGNIPTSSDILMDQSIPVEQLGTEFALVKGNGTIGSNMEGALIVSTEINTQVYVNNELTPYAVLNVGEYVVIPDTKYQLQGTTGHYNLYLRTTKKAYVYQLLAGDSVSGSQVATGGFNFIPALNCYLPKQINELGLINENFVHSNANPNGILNIPTKLNLITERGAVVTVNGVTPPATTGPFDMTGTTSWVTYGIPNTVGTITILSNKAITAGITAGSDAVGYGGFFAGFPTQPVILKTGDCVPGIVLTVDPIIYESYQWYVNGNLIPGATSSSYTPTQSGFFTCAVTQGSCAPLITVPFKVLNCTKLTAEVFNICTSKIFTPTFTTSTQTPVPSTVAITTPPTLGTAVINTATGVITYTVTNPNVAGTDTFTYTFCGNNATFPDCETVTVTLNIQPVTVNNATLTVCNINGTGTFNLSNAVVTSSSPITFAYYTSLLAAQNEDAAGQINNFTSYTAPNGTVVYAVVKNATGCKNIAHITLNLFPLAVVNAANIGNVCDENFDGIYTLNLTTLTQSILNNPAYFTNVRYYADLANANLGNNNTLPNNYTYTVSTTIYIRVESPDGCAPVIQPINLTVGTKIQLLTNAVTTTFCDDDFDGIKDVNIGQFISQFTTDSQVTYAVYGTLSNAQNEVNPLSSPVNFTGTQTVFIRFKKPGFCSAIGTLTITVKIPKKSDILFDKKICPKTKTTLDAGPGFDTYVWSTGATTPSIINVGAGNYWVDLTVNGCTYRQFVNVSESVLPVITQIDINGNTVTITATGGTPPYEYSIDGINWQTSNVFNDVSRGTYTAYVRDSLKCDVVKEPFVIINLINTITPNGDGTNDVIDYSALMTKSNLEFRIFDRYGAEVFRGTPTNKFTWDGNMKGRPVSTATYWYFISWTERNTITVKYSSWLLVKHRNNSLWDR
ncbi:gliding motility protein [Chryseobacterium sp. Leaf180]|uniref:T9SS type B sorting domain-containing protein n=1 Tax=Chryseobacterium sp. Leaf180 TaxID=1736289 RepID=UPI0006FCDC71|nr:T9SS type B sorting domain-containing protein [Chryseobacterium sp. Leaf180]KQR93875.1 gliding motility protein [Chryseobacterium sp. Leaf180]